MKWIPGYLLIFSSGIMFREFLTWGNVTILAKKPILGHIWTWFSPISGRNVLLSIKKQPLQLNIIESNRNVQYQTKRKTQSRDMSRKPDFGPNVGLIGLNLGWKINFQPQDHQYTSWISCLFIAICKIKKI